MSRLYPDITWRVENKITGYVRPGHKYIPLTVRWCEPCNGGWMHDLEDEARPILIPLIEGKRTILTPEEQEIIRTWFCLRAMVYDIDATRRAQRDEHRSRYFEESEHRQLAAGQGFHPNYEFFLAKYVGSQPGYLREDSFKVSFFRGNAKHPEGDITPGYSVTLIFKHLVLQIICVKSAESFVYAMPDLRAYCFKFGEGFTIGYPPPFPFGDSHINDFAERCSKYMLVRSVIPSDAPQEPP